MKKRKMKNNERSDAREEIKKRMEIDKNTEIIDAHLIEEELDLETKRTKGNLKTIENA